MESQYQKEISSSHQYEQECWASANLPRDHCFCCKCHCWILEVGEVMLKYLVSLLKYGSHIVCAVAEVLEGRKRNCRLLVNIFLNIRAFKDYFHMP